MNEGGEITRGGESPRKKNSSRFFRRWRSAPIPLILILVTGGLFCWSRQYYGKPPVIENLTPQIGFPGENMIIQGNYFGSSPKDGEVILGDLRPRRSLIREWTNRRIVLEIPESVSSGLVVVRNGLGESGGTLFTNRARVPGLIFRGNDRIQPVVEKTIPQRVQPGTILTLQGTGFGHDQGDSQVFFPSPAPFGKPFALASDGYLSWSNRQIRVRVPAETATGEVMVKVGERQSAGIPLEISSASGEREIGSPWTFTLQVKQMLDQVYGLPGNGLYVRVPLPDQGVAQTGGGLVESVPAPLITLDKLIYHLEDLQTGDETVLEQHFVIKTATQRHRVSSQAVKSTYNGNDPLVVRWTQPDRWIPSSAVYVRDVSAYLCRGLTNPYEKAYKLYTYTRERLNPPEEGDLDFSRDPVVTLDTQVSDAAGYARLFTALVRAQGIPARPVRGLLILKDREIRFHEWAEFYLEDHGWFPVDPYLGDTLSWEGESASLFPSGYTVPDVPAAAFYWGGLDPFHIAFSRGLEKSSRMAAQGKVISRDDVLGIVEYGEEAWGHLSGYRIVWDEPRLTGLISP